MSASRVLLMRIPEAVYFCHCSVFSDMPLNSLSVGDILSFVHN